MWTIECDGAHLGDFRGIDNKSVSRKHLVIHVKDVQPGEGTKLHARSVITLEDMSKIGTWLDDEKFKQETKTLTKLEHTFRLGSYQCIFKIKWNPVVFSFSFPSSQTSGEDDPIAPHQYRLEPLDIKTVQEYVTAKTTHLVASRRNTAKGLQALVNAKPIVTEMFIDALVSATTRAPNTDDPSNPGPSPLETDFDTNWPGEDGFLPASGKEPIPREAHFFRPNPERNEVFAGFTFVFLDSAQHDTLAAPINDGHGKALLHDVDVEHETADQICDFITNVSEYKDIDELRTSSQQKKGVVVVRMRAKGEFHDRMIELQHQVDLSLRLRSVDQNEFLEVILQNDASSLRRPLEIDEESDSLRPSASALEPSRASREASQEVVAPAASKNELISSSPQNRENSAPPQPADPEASEPQLPAPSRRRGRRAITASRFTGFDDFDDTKSAQAAPVAAGPEPSQNITQAPAPAKSTRSRGAALDIEIPASQAAPASAQPRKRTLSPSPDPKAAVDSLLPAAAALKRRRLERGIPGPEAGDKRKASNEIKEEPDNFKKLKREIEDVDYNKLLRSRREAEDEAARQDQEALKQALEIENLTVEDMKNFVKVEEMKLPVRKKKRRGSQGSMDNMEDEGDELRHDGNWSERWNGRKNFKGFKRKGQGENAQSRRQKVFVPMDEVKTRSFGLGSVYWENEPPGSKERRSDASQNQNLSQSQRRNQRDLEAGATQDDDAHRFRRRNAIEKSLQEDREMRDVESLDLEEFVEGKGKKIAGRSAKRSVRERDSYDTARDSAQHPSQTLRGDTQTQKDSRKRTARDDPEPILPPKRQSRPEGGRRAAQAEDEGDGLKFKFRRRKKDGGNDT
ncbi:MAG: hypothetical protein M1820_006184 [Bogoriella megaspora]|nr:MAG: hypothetical protein M1820_006184 [Bogoriella megaspora]